MMQPLRRKPLIATQLIIFSMFMSRVTKFEDDKNVENWKGGADGILVFVRCQYR